MKRAISVILACMMLIAFCSAESADNQYSCVINDEARLLTENEKAEVLEMMKTVLQYANVGFMTYPAGGSTQNSAVKACEWGSETFGSESRHVVFIIDMTMRHLDIYASHPLSGVLTAAILNSIAEKVYRYASRGEYGTCAVETFRLIENVLRDEKTDSGKFVFRGSITWGMSEEEVKKMEGDNYTRTDVKNFDGILYSGVHISRYIGALAFYFSSDGLEFCLYAVSNTDQGTYDYLKTALDSVYGDELETSGHEAYEKMSRWYEEFNEEADFSDDYVTKWSTAEDTEIYLIKTSKLLFVAYFSPMFLGLQEPEIDVTGL